MFEQLVLGMIQGVTEWLPISSKSMVILAETYLFGGALSIDQLLRYALVFHIGTFFAALVYLRKDVRNILTTAARYGRAKDADRKVLKFLLASTALSGAVGFAIFGGLIQLSELFDFTGKAITLLIGAMLLVTAGLQMKAKKSGVRGEKDLNVFDGIILGIAQGLTVIPGVSRSGTTVSALLLRKLNDTSALKLSFLMSLPAVAGANIILNYSSLSFDIGSLAGIATAFAFGLLTIDALMKLSRKIAFWKFTAVFGTLTLVFALLV
jgi:undecaprenyl-diphosphatase